MIEIKMFREGQLIKGFKISGHSGLARKGQDIYCAAVSAVSQTALMGLLQQLEKPPEYTIKDGWLEVQLDDGRSDDDRQKAQIILATMEAGLLSIAQDNPRRIHFAGGRRRTGSS